MKEKTEVLQRRKKVLGRRRSQTCQQGSYRTSSANFQQKTLSSSEACVRLSIRSSPALVLFPCMPRIINYSDNRHFHVWCMGNLTPAWNIGTLTLGQIVWFLEKQECPLNEHSSTLRGVGSSNGLICVVGYFKGFWDLYLFPNTYPWNPSIRVTKKLPFAFNIRDSARGVSVTSFRQRCGVGLDTRTNDYKVFQFTRAKVGGENEPVICNRLYSLKKDSWRVIETDCDQITYDVRYIDHGLNYMSFNGAFYWIGDKSKYSDISETDYYDPDPDLYERLILIWFDLCEEKFGRAKGEAYLSPLGH